MERTIVFVLSDRSQLKRWRGCTLAVLALIAASCTPSVGDDQPSSTTAMSLTTQTTVLAVDPGAALDVVGMSIDEATETLRSLGFEVETNADTGTVQLVALPRGDSNSGMVGVAVSTESVAACRIAEVPDAGIVPGLTDVPLADLKPMSDQIPGVPEGLAAYVPGEEGWTIGMQYAGNLVVVAPDSDLVDDTWRFRWLRSDNKAWQIVSEGTCQAADLERWYTTAEVFVVEEVVNHDEAILPLWVMGGCGSGTTGASAWSQYRVLVAESDDAVIVQPLFTDLTAGCPRNNDISGELVPVHLTAPLGDRAIVRMAEDSSVTELSSLEVVDPMNTALLQEISQTRVFDPELPVPFEEVAASLEPILDGLGPNWADHVLEVLFIEGADPVFDPQPVVSLTQDGFEALFGSGAAFDPGLYSCSVSLHTALEIEAIMSSDWWLDTPREITINGWQYCRYHVSVDDLTLNERHNVFERLGPIVELAGSNE